MAFLLFIVLVAVPGTVLGDCENYYCQRTDRHFELITVDNYVKGQTYPGCTEVTSDSNAPSVTQTWPANTTYRIKDSGNNNVQTPCKKWSPVHGQWYTIGTNGSSVITSEYYNVIMSSPECPTDIYQPPQPACEDQDQDNDGCPDDCDPWPTVSQAGTYWTENMSCDSYISYRQVNADGSLGDLYYGFGDSSLCSQDTVVLAIGGPIYDFNYLCDQCDCDSPMVSGDGSPTILLDANVTGGASGTATVSTDSGVDPSDVTDLTSINNSINENLKKLLQGQITEQDYLSGIQKILAAQLVDNQKNASLIHDAVNQQGQEISQKIQNLHDQDTSDAEQAATNALNGIDENDYNSSLDSFLPDSNSISELLDDFVSNNSMTDIIASFQINLNDSVCSVSIPLWGSSIDYSFCEYEDILSSLGYIILFISYVYSVFILVGRG